MTDCGEGHPESAQLLCTQFGLDHTTLQVGHAPDELLTISDSRA